MSKNTGIRIEAVREISGNGDQGYKIVAVEALLDNQLPKFYLAGDRPIIYIWHNGSKNSLQKQPGFSYITVGDFIPVQKMNKILAHIKAAGQHLADANAHLAKERESWQGKVTFIDGEEICNKITKKSIRPWEPWLKKSTGKTAGQPDEPTEQLYKITDGSWNLCSTKTNPIMKHLSGLALSTDNKYRIIDQGCDLPAYSPAYLKTSNRNNTIVQNIDTDQIVFTCIRFLCKI